jgi:hypothetical protein
LATLNGSLFCFSETLLNLWKQNTKQMIQPQELRYKNLVNYQGEIIEIHGVSVFDAFNSSIGDIPLHCIEPIPITEEWLKKLGFVYDDMSDTDDDNTWYHLDIGTVKFHSDKSCNFESVYCGVNMTKLEFKNVHKFQNFVFDLTGKELEFKL